MTVGQRTGDGTATATAPVPTERVPVDFAGDGEGTAEMSWGMWEIWHAMVGQGGALPIGGRAPLAEGTTVADLAEEMRYLLSRFPSMRTRLRFDETGHPTQELFASGTAVLEVYDADEAVASGHVRPATSDAPADRADRTAPGADPVDAFAAEVEETYRRTPFDYTADWPVRMAVIRHRGRPERLVTVMCHLVSDAIGGGIMLREVARRSTEPVTGLQQLDQARWQSSPAGQRQNDRAMRHWETILRSIPARQLPGPTDPRTPRHWGLALRSPALTAALPVIAERTGADIGTVFFAALSVALHGVTGISPVVIRPVVNNRFRPGLGDVVCMIAQAGVCSVDVADATLDEVVERARRATMSAYKYAYFHPERLRELMARISVERGEPIGVDCFLNDRSAHLPPPGERPRGTEPAQALREARAETTLTWVYQQDDPVERLFVSVDDGPAGVETEIRFDTHFLSPGQAEALARGIEAVAVEGALHPPAAGGAAR
jgi:hypothetical protein